VKKPLYIVGAGGLGKEVAAMLLSSNEWEIAGFFDDTIPLHAHINGIPNLGGIDNLINTQKIIQVVIAIGAPSVKHSIVTKLSANQLIEFPTIIHPSAQRYSISSIQIGQGSIISAGSILTTNISIGNHVLLNLNVTVGHDTSIGDCSSLMPGVNIAGQVTVGSRVLVGSGANIINHLKVGDDVTVGAGAVVISNIERGKTVVGVPAKEIRHK
jgi:sugar O-acyltransferase (sialic acid O-acetyltransferase NeuD family)